MPIFEYRCKNGHSFDKLMNHQQAANTEPMQCPECEEKAERIISGTNFQLKGKGWYKSGGY